MPNYSESKFFKSLKKPKIQPPDWVFTPVWILLYSIMVVSLILILNAPPNYLKLSAYSIFVVQLTINFSWSPVFFEMKKIRTAFWLSLLLLVTVGIMIVIFFKISPHAGIINIPYFIWCFYASILNYMLWQENKPFSNL